MDQITKVKKRLKQEQWKALIKDCQSSKMTVYSWCKANGICEQTYYRNLKRLREYSCAMKSHFRKFGNQMSGSGNHLCKFTRVMFYPDHIPLAWICHAQHQCL